MERFGILGAFDSAGHAGGFFARIVPNTRRCEIFLGR